MVVISPVMLCLIVMNGSGASGKADLLSVVGGKAVGCWAKARRARSFQHINGAWLETNDGQ
ncbi:hypothetical protein HEK131_44390 [Streptomyces seoulensis]|nr:hypothetical protein HEK131_44390 [Streptomyces seoulensis]